MLSLKLPHSLKAQLGRTQKLQAERVFRSLFEYRLSRKAPVSIDDTPDFNFQYILSDVDGLRFASPEPKEGGSLHRRLTRTKKLSRYAMFARHALASGGALIDIGANIGLTSIPHAVLRDFELVLAVEPEDRNYACLTWNAAANGADMVCRRAAVGAKTGTGILRIRHDPTHHALAESGKGERVDVVTVDQLASDIGHVSLIKVDVQGGEADVMKGARDLLSRREAAWMVEVMSSKSAPADSSESIVSTVEAYFDGFLDLRANFPHIMKAGAFKNYLASMSRGHTDFVFVP